MQEVGFAVSSTLNTCLLLPYRTSLHSLSQTVNCLCWSRDVNSQLVPISQNLQRSAERHREVLAVFQQGAAWQDAELAGVPQRPWQAQQVELLLATTRSGKGRQLQPPLEKNKREISQLLQYFGTNNATLATEELLEGMRARKESAWCQARSTTGQKSVAASDLGNEELVLGLLPSCCLGSVLFTCF